MVSASGHRRSGGYATGTGQSEPWTNSTSDLCSSTHTALQRLHQAAAGRAVSLHSEVTRPAFLIVMHSGESRSMYVHVTAA